MQYSPRAASCVQAHGRLTGCAFAALATRAVRTALLTRAAVDKRVPLAQVSGTHLCLHPAAFRVKKR
jgi:hypothetical protein